MSSATTSDLEELYRRRHVAFRSALTGIAGGPEAGPTPCRASGKVRRIPGPLAAIPAPRAAAVAAHYRAIENVDGTTTTRDYWVDREHRLVQSTATSVDGDVLVFEETFLAGPSDGPPTTAAIPAQTDVRHVTSGVDTEAIIQGR